MATSVVHDRDFGLKIGYDATQWICQPSFDEYVSLLNDWIISVIVRGDTPIGAVFRKGDELHVSILPEWRRRWMTKGLIRELFGEGRVTTRVTPNHDYMYDILGRLGFVRQPDGMMIKEV